MALIGALLGSKRLWALGAAAFCSAWAMTASAEPLIGVYNTGVSDVEGTDNASLDVEFGPCKDDPALSCGTIVRVVDPAPGAKDTMPDGSPVLGFTMVTGLKYKGEGKYRGGKINAIDESLNKDKMVWYGFKVDKKDGAIEGTGCLGPICPRKMTWTAVDGAAAADAVAAAAEASGAAS